MNTIEEIIRYQWWKIRCKIEGISNRLRFVFGKRDVMLLVHVFDQMAFEKSDASLMLYIGELDEALSLLSYGITKFYKRMPDSSIASIGYAPNKKTWYGWNHRAICGYKVGDVITPDSCIYESACDPEIIRSARLRSPSHPYMVLESLEDCKKAAELFAEEASKWTA